MASSEHILMEGDDAETEHDLAGDREPQQHFHIVNRSHAVETEMILFKGGWLSLRQHRRNKPGEARLINLLYVDPEPTVVRFFDKRSLGVSAALVGLAVITGVLALYSVQNLITVPATILLFTGAGVAFGAFAYRTRKDVVFHTIHGRAPVIPLMATLGCFRTLRTVVPKLVEEIRKLTAVETDRKKLLRSEMREHYRLRECGVLTEVQCTQSTQRILNHFE
jgi:hypothetical protein